MSIASRDLSDSTRPPPARARILFVNHTAELGGGEIALLNLVRQLDPARFEPRVVLLSAGPLAGRLEESKIETHVLNAGDVVTVRKGALGGSSLLRVRHVLAAVKTAWRLARFIRRHEVDLVHANSLKADLIAGIAGRLAQTPVIWHVRDRIADDYLPPRVAALFRRLAKVLPRFVIANSQATLDTLNFDTVDGSGESRYAVVHDGTPIHSPLPSTSRAHSDGPMIGLVGRISRWKGQDVFLRAAARVLEKFPTARFQIIGGPLFGEEAYEQEIRDLAVSLGIAERIWFAGFRSDVRELIDGLDVLVHASVVPEPFGQVVIEGMCASKPVVATAAGGVLEIVRDGVTGLLVPPGDAEKMASAVSELLADPVRAAAIGAAGRIRVQEHFSIALTAARVEAVYSRLLPSSVCPARALPTHHEAAHEPAFAHGAVPGLS